MTEQRSRNFDEMVERARNSNPQTMAERISSRREQELRAATLQAQESQRLRTETWQLAAEVVKALSTENVEPEVRLLGGGDLQRYLRSQQATGGPLDFVRYWRQDRLASRAIGGWDMAAKLTTASKIQESTSVFESDLFLGADGSIAWLRGMTEREWDRGVLIPRFARQPGEPFGSDHQYAEVRQGLANLVARFDLSVG